MKITHYWVIGIGVSALCLRLWAIDFGLPYLYHPDETNKITIAQNIFKTGDLNPHYFSKPTLFIYLNTAAYVPYYLTGKALGWFGERGEIPAPVELVQAVGRAETSTVILGRVLTTLFGVASVLLVYFSAKKLMVTDSGAAFAALMIAVSPTNVANSRYVTENTFLVFFILLTFVASLRIYYRGRGWDYVFAGIACGLAASAKYNGCLAVIIVLTAHFLRTGWSGLRDSKLHLALIAVPLAFLATTPFALLDHQKFLDDTVYEVRHYWTGHRGMEDHASTWYLSYLWQIEGPVCVLGMLGAGVGLWLGCKRTILISVFPILYFIFVSNFTVRNDRTLLPVMPFIYVLAACFLDRSAAAIRRLHGGVTRKLLATALAGALIVSTTIPSLATVRTAIQLSAIDSRERARRWIADNTLVIPRGSKIALERYSPFVDPAHFSVEGFERIIDHPVEWYIDRRFDFIVFSEGSFGRFYRDGERYHDQVQQYQRFFDTLTPIRLFTDDEAVAKFGFGMKGMMLPLPDYSSIGVYEIRLYRVRNRE